MEDIIQGSSLNLKYQVVKLKGDISKLIKISILILNYCQRPVLVPFFPTNKVKKNKSHLWLTDIHKESRFYESMIHQLGTD